MHASILDDVVIFPGWSEIHEDTWLDQIGQLISDEYSAFIPTLDLEIRLLAQSMSAPERILATGKAALDVVAKPPMVAASALGLSVPDHLASTDWNVVDEFVRSCPNGVWVKGQHYESFRASTVSEVFAIGDFITSEWGGRWHIEAHVDGQECGVAFCAVNGQLIDAVLMTKVLLTADGKTWSGKIAEVPATLWERLDGFVAESGWHGGGEIEMIQTWLGDVIVMEVNPRFPAWIHGATVCGANLPAMLIRGRGGRRGAGLGEGFTRLVEEVPVSRDLGVLEFPWGPAGATVPATKHPSGMRQLGRRELLGTASGSQRPARAVAGDADGLVVRRGRVSTLPRDAASRYEAQLGPPTAAGQTPCRVLLPQLFADQVAAVRAELTGLPDMTLGYSIKTCPHPVLLRLARDLGFVAEAITGDEMSLAVAAGFRADQAILNGPAKWWPRTNSTTCWAFFADSIDELEQLERRMDQGFHLTCQVVGIRVAAAGTPTRFGVRLDRGHEPSRVARIVDRLCRRLDARWGIHFHHAESVLGPARWQSEAATALRLADHIGDHIGQGPAAVDFGGGWQVDDLAALRRSIGYVIEQGPRCLRDGSARLILEPGKLLTQPAAAIVTQVLSSGTGGDRAVVVDAALADIPEARFRAHPVARHDGHEWAQLGAGGGRILGRSCMENDILAERVDLTGVCQGDYLAFGMCGAYDLAMSYPFGRGAYAGGCRDTDSP